MSENTTLTRRSVIKMLGVTSIALPVTRLAYASDAETAHAAASGMPGSLRFQGMAAPSLSEPDAMARVSVGSRLGFDGTNEKSKVSDLSYQAFFKTGDEVAGINGEKVVAGGYYDIHGQPIMDVSGPDQQRQFFSDCPDGMALLQPLDGVDKAALGVEGNPVFAVVQFEYTSRNLAKNDMYGHLPSPIAVLTFDQNPETGHLELMRYANVPTSTSYGLWITCGASRSPWNTHLSSEEYPTDAFAPYSDRFRAFITNLHGDPDAVNEPAKANPYLYNHVPEVTVNADGTGTIKKHFCLGRISHELVQVCPDERTVLMGDDQTNGGAFIFVADRARDLSSGTLYAAEWHQTSGKGPGKADLRWIRLGHATSVEIEAYAKTLKATDIMDVAVAEPAEAGFTKIVYDGEANWVRVKPGMETAAAFLETHRYAALRGASLGFTKWEGTTVNAVDKVAYVAMSYIKGPMIDGSSDIHVEGPTAGTVYALDLGADQRDTMDQPIDSEWVPTTMGGIDRLTGEDLDTPDELGNLANPDRVANPDNIKFSEDMRTLFVSEDSGLHVNNFMWAYNVDDDTCERVLSAPSGAESTGLQSVDNVNGWTYIMSNFQHPGDWESPLHDQVKDVLEPFIDQNYKNRYAAEVGYIAGMPRAWQA